MIGGRQGGNGRPFPQKALSRQEALSLAATYLYLDTSLLQVVRKRKRREILQFLAHPGQGGIPPAMYCLFFCRSICYDGQ